MESQGARTTPKQLRRDLAFYGSTQQEMQEHYKTRLVKGICEALCPCKAL
jgi:hypothetical protein